MYLKRIVSYIFQLLTYLRIGYVSYQIHVSRPCFKAYEWICKLVLEIMSISQN